MNRLIKSIISTLLLGAVLLSFPITAKEAENITVNAITASAPAVKEISVYVDGEKLYFDVAPIAVGGRTLVPMRKIFEYLGMTVEWIQDTKVIKGTCGLQTIMMQLGNKKMKINNDYLMLDVAPQAIDGRTLVPLRAVAEALQATVSWDGDTSSVHITTKYPKKDYISETSFDKYHVRTSKSEYEYVDFSIDGDRLAVKGHFGDASIEMASVSVGDTMLDDDLTTKLYKGKDFTIYVDLPEEKNMSERTPVYVWLKGVAGDGKYHGYSYEHIFIIEDENGYCFEAPLVYQHNINITNYYKNPIAYINPNIPKELVALSNEICKGCDDDYQKLIKIYDWMADNIYYNQDYYNDESKPVVFGALDVYKAKMSTCLGYSNLTMALVQAQGIPCRKMRGYSQGYGVEPENWRINAPTIKTTNHVWNQAYVNNRWVNMDTTWSSYNTFLNGKFEKKPQNGRLYFDISDIFIAYDHKNIIQALS